MFLNREPILKRLQEHWDYAVRQGVDPDRIVGVFLYGSQNYGFANSDSDVDSKLIIVPSRLMKLNKILVRLLPINFVMFLSITFSGS